MAVLSDKDIKKRIAQKSLIIKGYAQEHISMASIDLCLGNEFRIFKYSSVKYIDPLEGVSPSLMEYTIKKDNEPIVIHPSELILGTTKEYVEIPYDLVGRLDGRSSLARIGIIVHSTAGSIDPGFKGQITLEIANLSKVPVCLYPGMRVCRLVFDELSSLPEQTYDKRKDAKYKNQKGPGISKIGIEKQKK
ncbi:MAG: dCTP deaminase [Candidatus Woesearchaeota archaeon]